MLKAGLDWAKETHALCVIDEQGQRVLQADIPHTAKGLAKMLRLLARLAPPEQIPLAIERPSGLIVDLLVEAGHPVVPIHPNALKASRPRYRAAGGKSDPGDAYILADLLRTDGHRFRTLKPPSDEVRALRALVRTRDMIWSPNASPWPISCGRCWRASGLGPLGSSLKSTRPSRWPSSTNTLPPPWRSGSVPSGWRGSSSVTDTRGADSLSSFSNGSVPHLKDWRDPSNEDCKGDLVRALAEILERLVLQIRKLTSQVEQAVAQLPAGQVVMSFPRAGKVNAAQILAELGDDPSRFPTEAQLAAEAGVAPVTYASGKHRGVVFRFACNKRLRRALTGFAANSRHASPWARRIYAEARARGCDHPHAVRILARAWIRVLWKAWSDGLPYDPAKHGAAAQLAA